MAYYYAVSYQLNDQKDYQSLWDAFAELGAHKAMRSFYFVESTGTAPAVYSYLKQFIDEDDHLAVVPIGSRPVKYRCFEGTQAWIDERF